MQAFHDVFGTMHHLAWWQECLRALVVFIYGLAVVRVFGRRIFGRWSALDIVVSIVFGSSLARALTGSAPFGGTLAAMTSLVALHWVLAHASARWRPAADVLEGESVELARGGALHDRTRIRFGVSHAALLESLHGSGIQRVDEAALVMLEPSGKITIVKQV